MEQKCCLFGMVSLCRYVQTSTAEQFLQYEKVHTESSVTITFCH